MAFLKHTAGFLPGLMSILLISAGMEHASAQVQVSSDLEIQSTLLARPVPYSLILPADYYSSQKEYPVIYLLHGFGGDHTSWINRCGIDDLIDSLQADGGLMDCIYVLPNAWKSYYVNNYDSSVRYSDFFISELVPFIDSAYRTLDDKAGRALLGLSMGGYGGIMLALQHPDYFGTVVAFSAAVRTDEQFSALPQGRYEIFFSSVYGPGLNEMERINCHWKMNSPFYLVDSANAAQYKKINWYIDCGLSDPLLPANEAFHDLLTLHSIPHEYQVRPGNHNWYYWHDSVIDGFRYLDKIFRKALP